MPRVYNWQIGREMEYPYEAKRPRRQAAGVFNLNKCIGCQTCTLACKTTWTSGKGQELMFWNNVETKPWGSYPLGYDVKILSMLGVQRWRKEGGRWVYKGLTIFEAARAGERVLGYMPEPYDYANPNIGEDMASSPVDGGRRYIRGYPHAAWHFYMPRICNHCTFPACLSACPRMAIYKRPEDGIVLVDQLRCRGYRECVRGCPYKKVFYNPETRVSEKCVFCYPSLEKGTIPRCFRNCIGRIRIFGYISLPENADPENPVDFLVHIKRVAAPHLPHLGLEPNIYYVPPVHVDRRFIQMLFGPMGVEAVENYLAAIMKQDLEVLGALTLANSTDRIYTRFKIIGGEYVAGYDENGHEVVRVPIREPVYIRPRHDPARNLYLRNNP